MGKKLPANIKETLASFAVQQPLRWKFQDEARFGRISDGCYCWCKKPLRPLVKTMLSHQYVYAYGAVSPMDDKFDALVMPEVNGDWMQLFLTEIAGRYPSENIVMVVDGAGWHKRKIFEMPANLKLLQYHLVVALRVLETQNELMQSITKWDCIFDAVSNGN